ncbi:MAG: hypothetical protein M1832_006396 [Thelocarpon impressellum]|nr:MAG: hypothetical protein M1832_006396 [Thelocarpon impressellum]
MHNNDISVILGSQWKNERADVKAHFKSLADALKAQHSQAHPDYQYQPRKASEKKRRVTRRKMAAPPEAGPLPALSKPAPSQPEPPEADPLPSVSESVPSPTMADAPVFDVEYLDKLLAFEESGETEWRQEAAGKHSLQIPADADVFERLIDVYNETIATPNPGDFADDVVEWDAIDFDAGEEWAAALGAIGGAGMLC